MRIPVILLCVCTYGFLSLGEVSAQTVEPQREHPVPMIVSDANQEYSAWEQQFVNRKATYYFEGGSDRDVCDVRHGDLNESVYIWMMNLMLRDGIFSAMWADPVRVDEDAFYHLSDPACLTLFSSTQGVEIRWRLDNREFTSEAVVPAVADTLLHRGYLVRRWHGSVETTWEVTMDAGDDFGAYTDAGAVAGETYEYLIETLEDGATPRTYSGRRVHEFSGVAESAVWLTTHLSLETQHPSLVGEIPIALPDIEFAASDIDPTNDTVTLELYELAASTSGPAVVEATFMPTVVDTTHVQFEGLGTIPWNRYRDYGGWQFRLKHETPTTTTYYPHDDEPTGLDAVPTARYYNAMTCNRVMEKGWVTYIMKPTSPSWRSAVAGMAADQVFSSASCAYEGVWADNAQVSFPHFMVMHKVGEDTVPFTPFEYTEAGADSTTEFREGMVLAIAGVDAALPSGMTVVANAAEMNHFDDFTGLNAVTLEGSGWTQDKFADDWITRHDRVDAAVAQAVTPEEQVHYLSKATYKNPDNQYLSQVRLFDYASYLRTVVSAGPDSTYIPMFGFHGPWHVVDGAIDDYQSYEDEFGNVVRDSITPMIYPEQQIDLGSTSGPALVHETRHVAYRKFPKGEIFINFTWDGSKAPVSLQYILDSFPGLLWDDRVVLGEPHRLDVEIKGRTTSGGRIGFKPVAPDSMLGQYDAAIILFDPPAIPRILSDAQSTLFADADEWDLELRVVNPDTMTHFVEADISKLSTTADHFVQLYDDGSNGDDVAGDMVFTRDLKPLLGGFPSMSDSVLTYVEDARGYYQFGRAFVAVESTSPPIVFNDATGGSGINYLGTPYSTVICDVDEDGYQDILIPVQDELVSLQGGDNTAKFSDYTQASFSAGDRANMSGLLRGASFGDIDNDGHEDLFIARYAENTPEDPVLLFKSALNDTPAPDEYFVRIDSTFSDLSPVDYSWAVSWGDYNADGWLDLYVSRADVAHDDGVVSKGYLGGSTGLEDILLYNTSDGFFSPSWFPFLVTGKMQPSFASAWADVDVDGDMDLVVPAVNRSGASTGIHFFETVSQGQFEERSATWFSGAEIDFATSAAWADLDNDGDLDLVMAKAAPGTGEDIAQPYVFLKDNGAAHYTAASDPFVEIDMPTLDVRVLDYNLDGWADLLLVPAVPDSTSPLRPVRVMENLMGTTSAVRFKDVTAALEVGDGYDEVHGCSVADFNGDGAPDVMLGRSSVSTDGIYYLSDTSSFSGDHVTIELEGVTDVTANRSCIGTQVTLRPVGGGDPLAGTRTYGGGAGRGGDVERRICFGLTSASDTIEVATRWLNGFEQVDVVPMNGANPVTITDRTPPTIAPASVQAYAQAVPDSLVWAFIWETEYAFDETTDSVVLNGPSTGGQDVLITAANADDYHVPGTRLHWLTSFKTGCATGLHTITIRSAGNAQADSVVTTRVVKFCTRGS